MEKKACMKFADHETRAVSNHGATYRACTTRKRDHVVAIFDLSFSQQPEFNAMHRMGAKHAHPLRMVRRRVRVWGSQFSFASGYAAMKQL
jgi:hypothetical protein